MATIRQPRRAKSSMVLRSQALAQQRTLKSPPLPNLSSIPPTPSLASAASSRSTSSTSSGLRTPPPQETQPKNFRSPQKEPHAVKRSLDITERLNSVANELESYVEGTQSTEDYDAVHVAVRLRPSLNTEREVWKCDPLRGFIGGKTGEFFFGIIL